MNDRIRQLLKEETGDEIITSSLLISKRQAATAETVREEVQGFPFDQGWLCLTDQVLPLRGVADLELVGDRVILSGELAGGAESLHIRQAESGWTLTRLKAGEGEECLMLRESFVSTEEKQQLRLDYEVFWRRNGMACEPYACRFTGFSNVKEGA